MGVDSDLSIVRYKTGRKTDIDESDMIQITYLARIIFLYVIIIDIMVDSEVRWKSFNFFSPIGAPAHSLTRRNKAQALLHASLLE